MSKNLSSIVNPVDQIISELFKYINNFRISNKLNIFSRDRMSEHILSLLFRGKKEPPKDNDIEAKFVSYGCAFVDKIIHRISVVGNNSPNYQQYCSLIQQEINTNKNSPLLSNGNYTHMGFYIKNIEINIFIIFVFSTKILSFDRVIGCQDGNVLEGTIFKPDHFVEGINVKDIDSIRGIPFGPKNIRYNQNNNKFYICLLNSISNKINNTIKEIKCVYQNNINNIAYGASNALGRNVNFRGGNVAENQIISFKDEDKAQIFNGTCMDFISSLGFPASGVGSATKNKLDIKSKILSFNQNSNNDNNKFSFNVLTPKKPISSGLSSIAEDNNDLNKSFIRNSLPKFDGISPIQTRTLSPGNNNNKRTSSDFLSNINNVRISPIKNNFSNISNPFETKNKLKNDNQIINNNTGNNNYSNINNFSFNSNNNINTNLNNPINNINKDNFTRNFNNSINNTFNNTNNNGFPYNQNNIFEPPNQIQNTNNKINQQQNNNITTTINSSIGSPFDNSNNINNNIKSNLLTYNNNLQCNPINSNIMNNNMNNFINNNNINNNMNNNVNNNIYNNNLQNNNYQRTFINIEKNVVGYQIISKNIKFKSLIDVQNIGNQNINNFPKLIINNNQGICINLYNINFQGIQSCQTTSKSKEEFIKYLNIIKTKYPITKMDQINFVNNNLQIMIEDFYGKKTPLTYEKLLEIKKNQENNNDFNNIIENEGNMNINDLINKGQFFNIEFPYFNYKQDNDSKEKEEKENSQESKDNNLLNNSDIESKPIREKMFTKFSQQYLNEEEQKERYKYNPSFEHLYYSHDFSDVIIKLNTNSILAHKVVLASSSKVFMELIKSAEEEFMKSRNNNYNNGTNIIEILLPESFDFEIFNEIIKWIYCGNISENLSIERLRIMLMMSEKLKIVSLVKIIIIKHIIPKLNKENAISLCIDAYTKGGINKDTTECWDILLNYSLNYICKNSVSLIKTNPEKLLIMNTGLLIKCIKICMDNIVDFEQLGNLLQILIQKGIAKNIFDLLYKEVEKVKMCRCYDSQNINIDLLLRYFESENRPFSFPLINEETIINNIFIVNNQDININNINKNNNISPFHLYDTDKNINISEKNISITNNSKDQSFLSTSINSKKNIFLNNTVSNLTFGKTVNDDSSLNNSNVTLSNLSDTNNNFNIYENIEEEKNYNDICNLLSPNTNTNYQENLRDDKYHVFDFIFQFPHDFKFSDLKLKGGVSVFSEKFEYRQHLWSIKIDINSKGDISFFLIERGLSNNVDNNNCLLKYSSILFEFLIRDSNFEKSNQIFFSFVKNQYQIIGHKNFININQLTNKNKFHFILYIKRFPLHSGILQYISDNFNYIFLNKQNVVDKNKNLYLLSEENFNIFNNSKNDKNENNNPNIYQRFKSNNNNQNNFMELLLSENNYQNLKNEINNIKFEYLNMNQFDLVNILYSDYLPVESENNIIGAIYFYCMKKEPKDIDNIMKGIRFEFVNFRILCTLARDHDTIKNSPTFRKEFKIELKKRIKKMNDTNNSLYENSKKNRIYLRKNIKRKNYNSSINDDGLTGMNISDEIITFFLEKRHHEEYKDKILSLKKELQEEKNITNQRIKNLEDQNKQLNLEKNRLINENKLMKKKIINNRERYNQNNGINQNYNAYNRNIDGYNQIDNFIKENNDFDICLIF